MRMGVARAMLELGIKVREAGDVEARLAAWRSAVSRRKRRNGPRNG